MLVLFHLHARNVVVEFVPREVATKVVPNQDRLGDLSCREAHSTHHIPPIPLNHLRSPPFTFSHTASYYDWSHQSVSVTLDTTTFCYNSSIASFLSDSSPINAWPCHSLSLDLNDASMSDELANSMCAGNAKGDIAAIADDIADAAENLYTC